MKNFYSTCCDCGVDFCEVLKSGQQMLECPSCGLTTTPSEIDKLSFQLERDQQCLITRLEVQKEIQFRFPKTAPQLSVVESRDR